MMQVFFSNWCSYFYRSNATQYDFANLTGIDLFLYRVAVMETVVVRGLVKMVPVGMVVAVEIVMAPTGTAPMGMVPMDLVPNEASDYCCKCHCQRAYTYLLEIIMFQCHLVGSIMS